MRGEAAPEVIEAGGWIDYNCGIQVQAGSRKRLA